MYQRPTLRSGNVYEGSSSTLRPSQSRINTEAPSTSSNCQLQIVLVSNKSAQGKLRIGHTAWSVFVHHDSHTVATEQSTAEAGAKRNKTQFLALWPSQQHADDCI